MLHIARRSFSTSVRPPIPSLSSTFGRASIPDPFNEPLRDYAPGSLDRTLLRKACESLRKQTIEVPCVIGGKEYRTGNVKEQLYPSDNSKTLCTFHQADETLIKKAVENSMQAKKYWESLSFEDRSSIFLRAADLISHKYRYDLNAAVMLGQGKTVWQAEIDAIAETVDFLRFNVKFAEEIYKQQPPVNSKGVWNRSEYRPLEGYVVAISPFNFTAIGANLSTSPAIMGNVVLWKPASTSLYSNYLVYKILLEAGLPEGVIQFVPGAGNVIGNPLMNNEHFSGLHFTGSTSTFNSLLLQIYTNLSKGLYKSYPRTVGETGGKDFHVIHESADLKNAAFNTLRAAFEYQGQKCSACSRVYVSDAIWPQFKDLLLSEVKKIKMGEPDDFSVFMTGVIDKASFKSISSYIDYARKSDTAEIIYGGKCDGSKGNFIEPTIVQVTDPKHKLMSEEIFGPVLTIYVYPSNKFDETLTLVDETSPYALTGAIFANDRYVVDHATRRLKNASGNFYINDKCTGAVVGQQPFGGSRLSGTNDKAGASLNLLRWTSMRSIKENFIPLSDWRYPHLSDAQ